VVHGSVTKSRFTRKKFAISQFTGNRKGLSRITKKPFTTLLNEELIIVNNWTHKNFLFLNKRKTEVVIFGTDARISQVCFKVYTGNYELTRVSEFKYLGVVLDEHLSW